MSIRAGFLWMLFNEGLGKGASLLAQVFLGYLLTKEDFGLFALATSVSLVAAGFGNGGIYPILVQRGSEYRDIAPTALKFALFFNLLGCGTLFLAGPVAARIYGKPDLEWLLYCTGISLPLLTPFVVFRAKLAIDRRVRAIANLGIAVNWLRQGSTVLLAFLGFGALSFGYPVILEAVASTLAGWWLVKHWPSGGRLDRRRFTELFREARWVMPGTLAVHMAARGDYFVIGLFVDAAALGVYFFGLQLVASASAIFMSGMEVVMLPALAGHTREPAEQAKLFLRTLSALCLVSMPIAFAIAVFSEPLVQLVWQGRWNASIPAIQWLAASFPATLMISLSRALLEAQARWRLRFLLLALYGILGAAVAGAAAWRGDILLVAAAVAVYRTGFGLVQLLVAAWSLRIGMGAPLKCVLRPVIFIGTAALVAYLSKAEWLDGFTALSAALATYGIFLAAVLVLGFTVFRAQSKEVVGHLAASRRKPALS